MLKEPTKEGQNNLAINGGADKKDESKTSESIQNPQKIDKIQNSVH